MSKLKLFFNTGSAWVKEIEFETDAENENQIDIMNIIDENKDKIKDELQTYDYSELFETYTDKGIDELYIAVNGGEFYIHMIESFDFVK